MKNFPSILYLTLAFLLIQCKKESDPPPQPTKTDHITASPWKLEDAGLDQNKDGSIEFSVFASLPACLVDNTISFKTDNTGLTDEGSQKCNTSDPQSTAFNWSFADGEANINISNSMLAQINGKSKIVALTATNMTLAKDTTALGLSGWAIVKLKH